MPNPRILTFLLVFICSTVFAAWAKPLGAPIAVVAGFFGAGVGWVAARWLVRKIF